MGIIAERLKSVREDSGLNQKDFAASLGLKQTTYNGYETGGHDPKSDILTLIADKYDVTVDYLIGRSSNPQPAKTATLTFAEQRIGRAYGKADPPVQRTVEVALEPYIDNTPIKIAPSKEDAEIAAELEPEYIELCTYTQASAAGLGNYQDDEDYELIVYSDAPSRANIAVKISGDSMEPEYQDGDIVFVETESVLRDGEVGIFNYDSGGYIKVLRLNPVRLVSLNDKYDDIYVNQDGDIPFMTIGRVVGIAEQK